MGEILKAPLKPHARLGASSAHRWMVCPGSPGMGENLPDAPATPYQDEGTAAHALFEYVLTWGIDGPHSRAVAESVEAVDIGRPGGGWARHDVDQEMLEHVLAAVTTVQDFADSIATDDELATLEVEKTFSLTALNPPEDMFGTADVVVTSGRTLRVFDLKFGTGVVVEVLDNEQLQMYVVGALVEAGIHAPSEDWLALGKGPVNALDVGLSLFDDIAITIIQPRAPHTHGPVRTADLSPDQVRQFAQHLLERARATHAERPALVPGDHCKFCPAKGHCPALKSAALTAAAVAFAAEPITITERVDHLPLAEVASLYARAGLVREWLHAMEHRVELELQAGRVVPGFKLVAKKGKRQWVDGLDAAAHDLIAMGLDAVDVYEPAVLKSPAQIEKMIGRGQLPKGMAAVVSSGPTVAPEQDPRPALASNAVALLPPVAGGQTDQTEEVVAWPGKVSSRSRSS